MATRLNADTHLRLLASLPSVTGKSAAEWQDDLEAAPPLLRFDERVNWLRDAHDLPYGQAAALVHEQDLQRGQRRLRG